MYRKATVAGMTLVVTVFLGVALAGALPTQAQDAPAGGRGGQRGAFAGMQRVGGEVTAISGASLTVKTEDGATMTVVTTDNTRIMKGRGEGGGIVKFADLKVGDGVVAAGNLDAPNKTLHAALVLATDAAELKKLKDNLGKTYITGKVTAVDLDDARMTVERPDKVAQTIGFDETTSFRRGRPPAGAGFGGGGFGGGGGGAPPGGAEGSESITLADVKVGDNVTGMGSVKAGVFVPTQLFVNTPRAPGAGGGRRRGPGGAAAGDGGATPPASPPPVSPQPVQ